ncbi:MAG: dihydrofolate reductase family protein, partial [Bryocella sp.]
ARGAEVLVARSLEKVLRSLQEREIRSVMVEAGARVNAAFLRAGLVDKVVVYRSEMELGEGVPFAEGATVDEVLARLKDVEEVAFGGDVRVTGYLGESRP